MTRASPRDWPLRVQDIIDASAQIGRFVQGHTLESFMKDEKTVMAVLADFAIIGEALVHIPDAVKHGRPKCGGARCET